MNHYTTPYCNWNHSYQGLRPPHWWHWGVGRRLSGGVEGFRSRVQVVVNLTRVFSSHHRSGLGAANPTYGPLTLPCTPARCRAWCELPQTIYPWRPGLPSLSIAKTNQVVIIQHTDDRENSKAGSIAGYNTRQPRTQR